MYCDLTKLSLEHKQIIRIQEKYNNLLKLTLEKDHVTMMTEGILVRIGTSSTVTNEDHYLLGCDAA
jgi:hypothetical protein